MDSEASRRFYDTVDNFVTCKGYYTFENEEIKSILTHEQFEANVYKVKGEWYGKDYKAKK